MNANEFKTKAASLISQFEDLLQQMPQKGNTSTKCQRVNLQQHVNELSFCVNGVEDSDFIEDDDEDDDI